LKRSMSLLLESVSLKTYKVHSLGLSTIIYERNKEIQE
jgi:hypothetical protein